MQTTSAPAPDTSNSKPVAGSALLESVENKAHGGTAVADPTLLSQPIPEASIGASNAAKEPDPFQEEIKAAKAKRPVAEGKTGAGPAKVSGEPFRNPDMNNLPPEDQHAAAENMSKMIIQGYERGTHLLDGQLQIKEKTVLKIRVAGTIDMDAALIPIDGGMISFDEFIRTYNEQNVGTVSVSQEFKDDVTPILTRVLAKRGHGLTDEQMLIYMFGSHMAMNLQKFWAQKQTLRAIMDYGREMTKQSRESGEPVPAPAPAPERTYHQPAPAPSPASNSAPQAQQQDLTPPAGQGHTDEYQLPTWGANKKALDKAAKRKKDTGIRKSSITADPPERRKRVVTKNS